jgi:type IV pilus assembly protein PilA
MNGKPQRGFNLVELMIVLTIIGILGAVALPAYVQDYAIRAKLGEGVVLARALKEAIQETYQNSGPSNMACVSAETCSAIGTNYIAATKNVLSVTSAPGGIIQIKYQPSVLPDETSVLAIAPAFPSGTPFDLQNGPAGTAFVWDCGASSATPGVPGAGIAGGTNIPTKFLPVGCRP